MTQTAGAALIVSVKIDATTHGIHNIGNNCKKIQNLSNDFNALF